MKVTKPPPPPSGGEFLLFGFGVLVGAWAVSSPETRRSIEQGISDVDKFLRDLAASRTAPAADPAAATREEPAPPAPAPAPVLDAEGEAGLVRYGGHRAVAGSEAAAHLLKAKAATMGRWKTTCVNRAKRSPGYLA